MDFVEVDIARALLFQHKLAIQSIEIDLLDALGMYISNDVYAPIDVPNFDNSAMDGYGFAFEDFVKGKEIQVIHTIQAGDTELPKINSGEAVRIFTGAPIPEGVDTVVMQERTTVAQNVLKIEPHDVVRGLNIRKKSSQNSKGDLIVSRGIQVNSGIIGYLAGFGISKISVYAKPQIGILATGKELIVAGSELKMGQIYESNSTSLRALLKEFGIESTLLMMVEDDIEIIEKAVSTLLQQVDILLITGGISVGDYDFVHQALLNNGVEKVFYKVKQKPGKPLFFGIKDSKRIFALPGNPAATFTSFHQYVKPFMQYSMGILYRKEVIKGKLQEDYSKNGTLVNFVKGFYESGNIRILKGQESYRMDAFAIANCIVELPANKSIYKVGDEVNIIFI